MANTRSDNYQHRRHNKNLLMAYIILVTKYRKKILYGSLNDDIKQYIFESSCRNQWYIKRMETDMDHVHMLLQYKPTDSITKIVSTLKQQSTYCAWSNHGAYLRRIYWKEKTLWSDGYFAASIGQVSQKTIEHYIENQG